ncbi:MAG TPA: hypothetical protein ACFYEF_14075 [Candidatus Wunengus sp. YC63]|uniref:hypothetical protein n=1 Tax=unclassified Candidatus Wunengus TaxID=3367695 RepID=UPI0027143DC8|nr:hypothetical protein [Candidatus Brocadiales bacterium]
MSVGSISAVASVASAVATFGLVAFSVFQWLSMRATVKESAKSRYAQLILSVETIMRQLEPYLCDLRKLPDANQCASWGDKELQNANHVGAELQRVAFICEKGLIDAGYIMDGFGKDFVEAWNKLYLYIRQYRIHSRSEKPCIEEGAEFLKHFEIFAIKCAKHFKIQTPP